MTDQEQVEEIRKCASSFSYFSRTYLKINHPKRGLVPFELHPFQQDFIDICENNRFVLIPKCRQSGFATTLILWALWRCLFHLDQRILVIAKTDRTSIHAGRIFELGLKKLPEWLLPELGRDNDHEKDFMDTGSHILFRGPEACISRAATHLLILEAAYIPNMSEHWKSMYPIVSIGGKVIAISTPNGHRGWFYDTWKAALEGKNTFFTCTFDYKCHPEFDDEWAKEMRKNLGEIAWRQEALCDFIDYNGPEFKKYKIKPLVWESESSQSWRSKTVLGDYHIYEKKSEDTRFYCYDSWKFLIGFSSSLEDAKIKVEDVYLERLKPALIYTK